MTGWSTADNKFGLSPFIVGQVLGDGCNYTSIQAAITDATAAGGGNVLIRFGNYAEDVTMAPNVNLMGFSGTNLVNGGTSISGTLTASYNGEATISCIALLNVGGSPLEVTGANTTVLILDNVLLQANAAPAFLCSAANCAVGFFNCILSQNGAFPHFNITAGDVNFFTSTFIAFTQIATNSTISDGIVALQACTCSCGVDVSGTGAMRAQLSRFQSNTGIALSMTAVGNTLKLFNCFIEGLNPSEAITIGAGAFVDCLSTNLNSNAADAVIGTGTLNYDLLTFSGIAVTLAGTLTIAVNTARPIATASLRGLANFDAAQFVVTNGLVQFIGSVATSFTGDTGVANPSGNNVNILGGPGVTTSAAGSTLTINSVVYTDQGGSVLVASDTGSFATGAGTITLTTPAAPVQGELLELALNGSTTLVVQANAGQTIRIGNQVSSVAGTATSADQGDTLIMRFKAATSQWHTTSVIGNWVLA